MTDILGDLFAGKTKPAEGTQERRASRSVPSPSDATSFLMDDSYGLTAITEMAEEMRACGEGGRDTLLNTLCMKAGGLIRDGHLTRETAENYLRAAAMEISDDSFDEWQIDEKLERVIEEGIESDYERVPREAPLTEIDVPPPASTPEKDAATRLHEQMVRKELAILRARDEAKRLFAAEKAAAQFRVPPNRPTLAEELLIPSKPVQYRIDRLLPIGGNVLLPAQYKAGKTTTVNNLVASYADAEPFLGKFEMFPAEGRIAVWNYEVGEDQYREWLRDVGVKHPERVVVLNLRGFRVPITAPTVEDWCVEWLQRHEVSTWVMDPFARAATGVDENSNTEVGVWLDTFDVIKSRAGVLEGVLVTHTGREVQEAGQERARGATRLDDWADVRWILTRDDAGARFFRATGRDVEVEEEKLSWDAETRRTTFGGWDRRGEAKRRLEDAVVAYIAEHPGCSGEELEKHSGLSPQKGILAARDRALASHRIRVEEAGARGRKNHFANLI